MKFNSKILGILLALLTVAVVISSASAVNLVNDFKVDVPPETNFTQTVNITVNDMDLAVFENSANNSDDVNSVIYLKDSTADKKEINGFIKGLENEGTKVEETDRYIVLKNARNSNDFDIGASLDDVFSFADSIFSSDGVNFSSDGNSISLSGDGLEISEADGENVSITSEGISVSGEASSGNETVNVSGDVGSNLGNCDYSIYMKNQGNDKVIVISGNNLEALKSMAETASFNEN